MRTTAYVIMPVGSDSRHAQRRSIIESAAKGVGIEVFFPLDYRHHSQELALSEIQNEIRDCAVVIGDLTLERPSCYYELGIVHGLGKPTILLAEVGTPIHQVVGRSYVVFYGSFEDLNEKLQELLRQHVGPKRHSSSASTA